MTQMQIHEYPEKPLKLTDNFIKDNAEYGTSRVTYGDLVADINDQIGNGSGDVTLDDLPEVESFHTEDKFLLGVNGANKSITAESLMKGMNGYLPKGTKIITKEFNISSTKKNQEIITLQELGISLSDIVGINAFVKNIMACVTPYIDGEIIGISADYDSFNIPSGTTGVLSIFVKDFSEIGSKIVTENVKIITKEIDYRINDGTNIINFGNISDFGIDERKNVVGITAVTLTGDVINGISHDIKENGNIIGTVRVPFSGSSTGSVQISLFVRVPVVEQLPRFTKDVVISTSGYGNSVNILKLDGSDNCGGFTLNNFHSISVNYLSGGAWRLSHYYVKEDGNVACDCNTNDIMNFNVRITVE